jgi:hypothetical protein
MPFILRKLKSGLYRVRLKDTGQILSYATTYENAMKQIKFLGMRDKMKGGKINDNIQSIIFNKKFNTIKQADKWLRDNDFIIDKTTYNFNSPHYLRYRQHKPLNGEYEYRMKLIDPERMIYFVMEYRK